MRAWARSRPPSRPTRAPRGRSGPRRSSPSSTRCRITLLFLGRLRHLQGRLAEARALFAEAAALSAEAGYRWGESLASAHLGAIEAASDDVAAAEDRFAAARRSAAALGNRPLDLGIDALEGVLDLARARRSTTPADHVAAARRRLAALPADRIDETRFVARLVLPILASALAAPEAPAAATHEIEAIVERPRDPEPEADLEIHRDGHWFRTREAGRVDIQRRQAMRRILLHLVERRLAAPGAPVSASELVDAGWPGERILASAASNRFYNAVAVLRGLGLRAIMITTGDGYALDPARSVRVVGAP